MRVFGSVGIRVVVMEPGVEMAPVAVFAAIRAHEEKRVEQEFAEAASSGPVEWRATAIRTTERSSKVRHCNTSKCWLEIRGIHLRFAFWNSRVKHFITLIAAENPG